VNFFRLLGFTIAWTLARRCNAFVKLSFSQEGEDQVLCELAGFKNLCNGFYVDVGAHHPWRFSNTAIYFLNGWRGLNIDPTPGSMELFRKLRPKDISLELAVSDEDSERKFYIYNEPALNGIDCDRTEELKNTRFRLLETISVQAKPLGEILSQHVERLPSPNFLTVDAEGHDLEVLRSNDWTRFPFDWVLTELHSLDLANTSSHPVVMFLASKSYRLRAFTGRTGIFSRI
jgi:FkbM family methyltransferase